MSEIPTYKGLPTADDVVRFTELYCNSNVTIADICRIFGYAPGSVYRMGYELGLKRPKGVRGTQLNLKQIRAYIERVSCELPAVSRKFDPRPYRERQNALDFVLFFSDAHAGRITKSTNAVVLGLRMEALAERIARIVHALSLSHDIGQLYIFCLGDLVTGESVGYNINIEELEHTILQQCFSIAIPRLTLFTLDMLDVFKVINIKTVPGNHGNIKKFQASKANWDTVVALGWQSRLSAHMDDVIFDVDSGGWYNTATVKGTDWLLIHGDQFKGAGNYNNIVSGVTQWRQTMREHFDHVAMAHFHHWFHFRNIYGNGCLLTDDDWSKEVIKRDADCVQLLLVVDNTGVRDVMPIWLDDILED